MKIRFMKDDKVISETVYGAESTPKIQEGKYLLDKEKFKEFLGQSEEFVSIDDACNRLKKEAISDLKKFLNYTFQEDNEIKRIVANNGFSDLIEWMRSHCAFADETGGQSAAKESEETEQSLPEEKVIYENDFEKIRNEFESTGFSKLIPLEGEDLDVSAEFILHEGGIVTQNNDPVKLYVYKEDLKLDQSKMLVAAVEGTKVFAMGHLLRDASKGNEYYVILEEKDFILYDCFKGQGQVRFVVFDQTGKAYSRVVDMDFRNFAVEEDRPLCIDFGTSNTTVGSYGIKDKGRDEVEIVHFIDKTVTPPNTEAMLLPTVIYVEDCSNPQDIKYLFGYDARKRIEEEHYESAASVYFEIKRWMSSEKEEEEIRDIKNNKARPMRQDIIKAYIDYVIEAAEQYFGTRFVKIHFSAPVKLKEHCISVFHEIYHDKELYGVKRNVLSGEDSIDEGIAIVYNQIIKILEDYEEEGEKERSIMIMDCGGGTTDLASCAYSAETENGIRKLTLKTCFMNGNSNFGGNNITYRIMQLLKIKIAAWKNGNADDGNAIKLIDHSENDILELVENEMKQETYNSDFANGDIYGNFLQYYEKAEAVIPTKFSFNEKYGGKDDIKKIKRNFYYLWRKAEQIKIDFYATERVMMDFKEGGSDREIQIKDEANYYLYIAEEDGGRLKRLEKPFQNISITINEINRVICGDVYSLLVGLFGTGQAFSDGSKVDEFDLYKLSGQSCKISLFTDLIKEYIPGRKLRSYGTGKKKTTSRKSEDLKLDCIKGCIHYVKDQLRPEMNVSMKQEQSELIYDVVHKKEHSNDELMFDSQKRNEIKLAVIPDNTKEYPVKVVSKGNDVERDFIFKLDSLAAYQKERFEEDGNWNTEEIANKLANYSSVDERGINEFTKELRETAKQFIEKPGEIIFVVPSKSGYGFYIGQIGMFPMPEHSDDKPEDKTIYRMIEFEYENFEDVSKTFFDGRR